MIPISSATIGFCIRSVLNSELAEEILRALDEKKKREGWEGRQGSVTPQPNKAVRQKASRSRRRPNKAALQKHREVPIASSQDSNSNEHYEVPVAHLVAASFKQCAHVQRAFRGNAFPSSNSPATMLSENSRVGARTDTYSQDTLLRRGQNSSSEN